MTEPLQSYSVPESEPYASEEIVIKCKEVSSNIHWSEKEEAPLLNHSADKEFTDNAIYMDHSLNLSTQSKFVPSQACKNGTLKYDTARGLMHFKAVVFLILWYFFSFTTLFLNKYILSYMHGDPTVLGCVQLILCSVCGYLHMIYPSIYYKSTHERRFPHVGYMLLVGSLRFSTLLLGLIALWFVPVSFAETVKSSAPVFTVIITFLLMKEKTSWLVSLSLIPVMGGLVLCSANELSFNITGFIAAMATNLSECLQNVFSKILLSGESHKYSPPELQFYTSTASILVQVPSVLFMVNLNTYMQTLDKKMITVLILNGLSFHGQSIAEYTLLGYISPVTHSVANTVKRALLIWLSVLTFGNPVTFYGVLGTVIVILGVLFYNKARELSASTTFQTVKKKKIYHL